MVKPALAIKEQIELLVQRGLAVPLPSDPDCGERQSEYHAVMRLLVDNNYNRLSGYWRHFQANPGKGNNQFTTLLWATTKSFGLCHNRFGLAPPTGLGPRDPIWKPGSLATTRR